MTTKKDVFSAEKLQKLYLLHGSLIETSLRIHEKRDYIAALSGTEKPDSILFWSLRLNRSLREATYTKQKHSTWTFEMCFPEKEYSEDLYNLSSRAHPDFDLLKSNIPKIIEAAKELGPLLTELSEKHEQFKKSFGELDERRPYTTTWKNKEIIINV